jgi:hypothetical protein
MGHRPARVKAKKEKFLEVLRATCNVSESAIAARIRRRLAYQWRDKDEEFRAAWDDAEQEATDALEREAWRRAVEGVDKPVTFKGEITDTYKEYSDRLLEMLLRGHRPHKYKDRVSAEVSGPGGGPIQTEDMSARDIIASELARLAARKEPPEDTGEAE